jgi:hypothetical protein
MLRMPCGSLHGCDCKSCQAAPAQAIEWFEKARSGGAGDLFEWFEKARSGGAGDLFEWFEKARSGGAGDL